MENPPRRLEKKRQEVCENWKMKIYDDIKDPLRQDLFKKLHKSFLFTKGREKRWAKKWINMTPLDKVYAVVEHPWHFRNILAYFSGKTGFYNLICLPLDASVSTIWTGANHVPFEYHFWCIIHPHIHNSLFQHSIHINCV